MKLLIFLPAVCFILAGAIGLDFFEAVMGMIMIIYYLAGYNDGMNGGIKMGQVMEMPPWVLPAWALASVIILIIEIIGWVCERIKIV